MFSLSTLVALIATMTMLVTAWQPPTALLPVFTTDTLRPVSPYRPHLLGRPSAHQPRYQSQFSTNPPKFKVSHDNAASASGPKPIGPPSKTPVVMAFWYGSHKSPVSSWSDHYDPFDADKSIAESGPSMVAIPTEHPVSLMEHQIQKSTNNRK